MEPEKELPKTMFGNTGAGETIHVKRKQTQTRLPAPTFLPRGEWIDDGIPDVIRSTVLEIQADGTKKCEALCPHCKATNQFSGVFPSKGVSCYLCGRTFTATIPR